MHYVEFLARTDSLVLSARLVPGEVSQLAWGLFNDSLEKTQESETKWDLKTLVVASVYLAIEFLGQKQANRRATAEAGEPMKGEEAKSPGANVRAEALEKYKALGAVCSESTLSRAESLVNYEEFNRKNDKWWMTFFNVPESDLAAAAELILSIYQQ